MRRGGARNDGRRGGTVVVLGCPFSEIVVIVVDSLNPADHIAVEGALFEDAETMGPPCLDHATAVCKHLNAPDFEHGAEFGASACAMTGDRRGAGGDDHAKGGARFLETAAEHQAVTGLEKVEEGGHAGERQLADKDGGIQACIALFALD